MAHPSTLLKIQDFRVLPLGKEVGRNSTVFLGGGADSMLEMVSISTKSGIARWLNSMASKIHISLRNGISTLFTNYSDYYFIFFCL